MVTDFCFKKEKKYQAKYDKICVIIIIFKYFPNQNVYAVNGDTLCSHILA